MEFPTSSRACKLAEAVRIIKGLWSEARTSFDGEFYHLKDALIVPKPVQRPPCRSCSAAAARGSCASPRATPTRSTSSRTPAAPARS
jgi:alkanesulfonate monooxygenase SsuD/methylene tetrahydromethanopterin reductase-like flavin-dependent oxidoreductase (luciferase family)